MKVESDVLIYFHGTINAQNQPPHKTEVQTSSFCSICFGIDLDRCRRHQPRIRGFSRIGDATAQNVVIPLLEDQFSNLLTLTAWRSSCWSSGALL